MTLVLCKKDLAGLLSVDEVIAAVEASLISQQGGEVISPMRMSLSQNGRMLLAMPAITPVGAGVKTVSVVPENAKAKLPVTLGVMTLLDPVTAQPLCIMDAAALTRQRTGAVGAIGVKHISPLDTDTIGIVGCGVQGTTQAIYACGVRPVGKVFALEPTDHVYNIFVDELSRNLPGIEIARCLSARDVLANTGLVIAATTSPSPVLPDERDALLGKKLISIGSFRPDMQELPDLAYELASTVLVDSEHAVNEVGDLINPLRKGLIDISDVVPISRLVSGADTDGRKASVYKAVGDAFFDVFVANAFYRRATELGIGIKVDL